MVSKNQSFTLITKSNPTGRKISVILKWIWIAPILVCTPMDCGFNFRTQRCYQKQPQAGRNFSCRLFHRIYNVSPNVYFISLRTHRFPGNWEISVSLWAWIPRHSIISYLLAPWRQLVLDERTHAKGPGVTLGQQPRLSIYSVIYFIL